MTGATIAVAVMAEADREAAAATGAPETMTGAVAAAMTAGAADGMIARRTVMCPVIAGVPVQVAREQ